MAERTSAVDNAERLPSSPRAPAAACASAPQRSSTRQAASQAAQVSTASAAAADSAAPPPNDVTQPTSTSSTTPRKRKSTSSSDRSITAQQQPGSSGRRSKRQKIPEATSQSATPSTATKTRRKKGKPSAVMDSSDSGPPDPPGNTGNALQTGSSSRKSSRSKKSGQDIAQESTPNTTSSRRSRRTTDGTDNDTVMTGTEENRDPGPPPPPILHPDSDDNEDEVEGEDDDDEDHYDDDDPFGGFGGPGGMAGLSGTLRALTGMMSGLSSRLRELLQQLRTDDLSIQLIALQELSEILLVSNEDNLSGHFSPDAFVKELVVLMNKEESPEIMLLACRSLANLMEALPASTANVVYGGAVPVLCQKLLEISFIDLAEQALSTLEKISQEFPGAIVREGGLTACLSYLDFFATSTQRTAVTIAANCCRQINTDSFHVVRDVMPTLLGVLSSSDQRVVEQASLCVSGIIDSFKADPSKLEELVSVDLLRAVLQLLVPGTTNLIGSNIHTQYLRVLAITARSSPRLSSELFKLNVVETLYQILTGVSPPSGTDDVASKLDSVVIMQALIHRPREQIIETLNVICQLLPSLPKTTDPVVNDFVENHTSITPYPSTVDRHRRHSDNDKRIKLLETCKDQVRRFALIIFPTLTDAYSSTVNLSVRQKVLIGQLKMLSTLDKDILTEALVPVPYASFLASILSQQDHPSLVMLGLQATELLVSRLDHIYRYQFYREGVISEITALANAEHPSEPPLNNASESSQPTGASPSPLHPRDEDIVRESSSSSDDDDDHEEDHDDDEDEDEEEEDDDDNHDGNEAEPHRDAVSPVSSRGSTMSLDAPIHRVVDQRMMKHRIHQNAKKFLEVHDNEGHGREMKAKAAVILGALSQLASDLEDCYLKTSGVIASGDKGHELFTKLASYFDADVLESVTSAELLASGLVRVLLEIFTNPDEELTRAAHSTFLEVFMGRTVRSKPKTATADSPATPFSVMVHKLQDLLSRSEHFEVITVHQNSLNGSRSSATTMLGKQIRLRLVADEESDIPASYRSIMVSIHAIATFKSLDEYLRPRISLSERPRGSRRDGLSRALAAMAGTAGFSFSNAAAARLADRSPFGGLGAIPPPPPPPAIPSGSSSRALRKTKSKSLTHAEAPATPDSAAGPSKGLLRRSSRHHAASADTEPATRPPPTEDDQPQDTLECADEKQLTDEEDMDDTGALDAIVGELEEEMGDGQPAADPSAVNLEVASSGGVTARKEDGERVPTPASSGAGTRPPVSSSQSPSAPAAPSSSRTLSYASALQATPQDWHIEFMLDEKAISHDTTIYRAVHTSTQNTGEPINRSIWSSTYPVKFRRVPGPLPSETLSPTTHTDTESDPENGMPASLTNHPTTASILQLLRILHDLNANIEDVLINQRKSIIGLHTEPLSQFVNTKLTAKLNRQLEEPLIVASACLPSWSEDLARLYPFLFPFETRHLFIQSTSFGYARSMARWQNAQAEDNRRDRHNERPFLGRLQRQKVRLSRQKILESAIKVMELYGASQSILEVEYFEEVGTGLGPTLEFYSTVSREFSKKKLKLWRETDSMSADDFVSGQTGLFPRPLSDDDAAAANGERILQLFRVLGKFVARSMIDSRIIDINLNPIFFRIGDKTTSGVKPSLGAVKMVDPGLARSLMTIKNFALAKKEIDEDPHRTPAQKVADTENIVLDNVKLEDLCLDFTLPGYGIELVRDGAQKRVTIENVDSYLERVVDATLGSGVHRQVDAFRTGFSQVFPYSALSAFTPEELVNLFGKAKEDWSLETLLDSIKADHGYNMDSRSVRNLLQSMCDFNATERRDFLQFTTGSPKLPIGGFKSLTPMFTVVCKPREEPYMSDDYLPSVMTCVNYLKLPDYTNLEVMKKQLSTAMREGQGAFLLS